jgi:outer membrane protein assembly factor BamB
VYIGSSDGNVYAANARNGGLIWTYTTTLNYTLSTPTVANGLVYVGSADNNLYALNASNGSLVWKFTDLGAPMESSTPAVANGVVYEGTDDFNFYAVNAATGKLIWKYATHGPINSSAAVANGVVYFASDDANFYALQAQSGKLLWQYSSGSYFAGVVVTNGRLYLDPGNNLYVFGLPTDGSKENKSEAAGFSQAPKLTTLHPDFTLQTGGGPEF